ncbi:hypothetical protein K440DRAFT_111052 [Wilcoxina mikolae CBS 423.85]|nr:hypothetical protein K440DRAFT_111052 [Wilcoxina mikolae CBS 423.85]
MRCKSPLLFTVLMMASTLVAAIPSGLSDGQSLQERTPTADIDDYAEVAYKKLLERGVDPNGPIPRDYIVKTPEFIKYKRDSLAALWVDAQDVQGVQKRAAGSGVDVVGYTGQYCDGDDSYAFLDVQYGIYNWTKILVFQSMRISRRNVNPKVEKIELGEFDSIYEECYDIKYSISGRGCISKLPEFSCFWLRKKA